MLEHDIIEKLLPGPQRVADLVGEMAFIKKVSIQGVYKALRKLRHEEVVTFHNRYVSLSRIWIESEKQKMSFAERAYHSAQYIEHLAQGASSKESFVFHSLIELDLFWTHSYTQLIEHINPSILGYSIQPHDWYSYVRQGTDVYWVAKHSEGGRLMRTLLTHSGELDRLVLGERKKLLGKLFEFTLNENPLKQDVATYYNLIGPYIFTARFDTTIAERLHEFILRQTKLPLSVEAQREIDMLVRERGQFKLIIERSEIKANIMEQKVKKYFEF